MKKLEPCELLVVRSFKVNIILILAAANKTNTGPLRDRLFIGLRIKFAADKRFFALLSGAQNDKVIL